MINFILSFAKGLHLFIPLSSILASCFETRCFETPPEPRREKKYWKNIRVYRILHSKRKIGKFKFQLQVLLVESEVSYVPNVIKIRKLLLKIYYIYRHYISSMSGCWSFINTRGFSRYSFRHSFSSVWSLYNYEIICFIKTCNKTQ